MLIYRGDAAAGPEPPEVPPEDPGDVYHARIGDAHAIFAKRGARQSEVAQVARAAGLGGAGPAGTVFYVTRSGAPPAPAGAEAWAIDDLQIDIASHRLVPRMTKVAAADVRWPRSALPLILPTDPMARYLAMKPGDVVRIQRPVVGGYSEYYRVCAPARFRDQTLEM